MPACTSPASYEGPVISKPKVRRNVAPRSKYNDGSRHTYVTALSFLVEPAVGRNVGGLRTPGKLEPEPRGAGAGAGEFDGTADIAGADLNLHGLADRAGNRGADGRDVRQVVHLETPVPVVIGVIDIGGSADLGPHRRRGDRDQRQPRPAAPGKNHTVRQTGPGQRRDRVLDGLMINGSVGDEGTEAAAELEQGPGINPTRKVANGDGAPLGEGGAVAVPAIGVRGGGSGVC
jgi:hypothetical protein